MPQQNISFGFVAQELLENPNKRASRPSWDYFIVVMPSLLLPCFNDGTTSRKVNDRTSLHIGKDTPLSSHPYFAKGNKGGDWQPGWLPSQEDIFASDYIIEEG